MMRNVVLALYATCAHALIAPIRLAARPAVSRSAPFMVPVADAPRVPGTRIIRFTGKVAAKIISPVKRLRHFTRRRPEEDLGICVDWGDDNEAMEYPPRRWYLCSSPPSDMEATCQLIDEEIPGFNQLAWACSVPRFQTNLDYGEVRLRTTSNPLMWALLWTRFMPCAYPTRPVALVRPQYYGEMMA